MPAYENVELVAVGRSNDGAAVTSVDSDTAIIISVRRKKRFLREDRRYTYLSDLWRRFS
jgi:hypothetical protein